MAEGSEESSSLFTSLSIPLFRDMLYETKEFIITESACIKRKYSISILISYALGNTQ